MKVLLYLGVVWILYGVAGLFGWHRINKKYKGYEWTKKYIRCVGISWLMLGIPCIIFHRLFAAGYNTSLMYVLMCISFTPSLIYTILIEKKYSEKLKNTDNTQ